MANIFWLFLRSPLRSLCFFYSFCAEILLVILRRLLLPHHPTYQSLRALFQRAYLSCAHLHYPQLVHRLPVSAPAERARKLTGPGWTGYLIPGQRKLEDFARVPGAEAKSVVLYAHGGGYATGEARMYLRYMERWVALAQNKGLDVVFVSVEYRTYHRHWPRVDQNYPLTNFHQR